MHGGAGRAQRRSPGLGALSGLDGRSTRSGGSHSGSGLEGTHAPDEVYAEVRDQFSEEELVELTVAIGLINTWNRLAIGFRYTHPVGASKAA